MLTPGVLPAPALTGSFSTHNLLHVSLRLFVLHQLQFQINLQYLSQRNITENRYSLNSSITELAVYRTLG